MIFTFFTEGHAQLCVCVRESVCGACWINLLLLYLL